MLHWDPEKRATAEEMLAHPWLKKLTNESSIAESKMSEAEFEEYMKLNKGKEREPSRREEQGEMSELCLSDNEVNEADDEFELDLEGEDADYSGLGTTLWPEKLDTPFSRGGGIGQGKVMNNSFGGPYSNMDHIHNDRGENPQFQNIF